MKRLVLVLVGGCLFGVVLASIGPPTARAASPCNASFVMLGQMPGITGATSTDWFNVFGEGFDASVPAVLTFGAPVIPYRVDDPTVVQPAVTAFTMPAKAMSEGFKWTFRTRDTDVKQFKVTITGPKCQATTVVFTGPTPPATSTEPASQRGAPWTVLPIGIVLAVVGGLVASGRAIHARH